MKPESRPLRKAIQRILMIAVLLFGFLSLSGCITNKVLDLRRARETRVKEATNFWSLAAVRSGYVVASSDAFACVEFRDSPADAPKAFTINLSQASRIGKTFADFMPVGYSRAEQTHGSKGQADMSWHLYPLQDAQKGCGKSAGDSLSPISELKIEALQIRREDQSRLPGILSSSASSASNEGRIIEISFASDDHETKTEPSLMNGPVPGSSDTRDVLLLYLPPAGSGEPVKASGVAGAFEPGSEWVNPYTLMMVPAVAADTAIITTIIMLGGRFWEYR
jgi:hypothetical protein